MSTTKVKRGQRRNGAAKGTNFKVPKEVYQALSPSQKKALRSMPKSQIARPPRKDRPTVAGMTQKEAIQTHKGDHDARVTSASNVTLMAPGANPAVVILCPVSTQQFWGVAWAYVCAAIQRGYLSRAQLPSDPFAAAGYIVIVLNQSANGITPAAETLPYWLKCLCDAVSPVNATPFGNGGISYKFTGNSGPITSAIDSTPVFFGLESVLYVDNMSGSTDLFPIASPPVVPTDVQQQNAFNNIAAFMATLGGEGAAMVKVGTTGIYSNDVSAFSINACLTGFGYNAGAWAFEAQLEVPVTTPMLAAINAQTGVTQGGAEGRWGEKPHACGGDSLFLGNAWGSLLHPSLWGMKKKPRLHQIDFLEFGDVLAQWLGYAVDQYFKDPANVGPLVDGADQSLIVSQGQCPITLQEMLLLLRNEIMVMLGSTQAGVQGLGLQNPTAGNVFCPYQAGTNCAGISSVGMKLPMPLIENLRSLSWHIATNRRGKDPVIFYPVLGQFSLDVLNSADYVFHFTAAFDSEGTLPLFTAVPPLETSAPTTKGVIWTKLAVETPIRLIDGNDGTNYVFINDLNRLKTLATFWNEFVQKFAAYTSPQGTLSVDGGVNVLCSINLTRHLSIGNIEGERRAGYGVVTAKHATNQVVPKTEVRDPRVVNRRQLANTPYAVKQIFAVSYQSPPFAATFDITDNWILPVNWITFQANGLSTDFTRVQLIEEEPCSTINSTTGNNGILLSTLHSIFAESMIHARDAPASPFESLIMSMSSDGKAGVLSELVGGFLQKGVDFVGGLIGI